MLFRELLICKSWRLICQLNSRKCQELISLQFLTLEIWHLYDAPHVRIRALQETQCNRLFPVVVIRSAHFCRIYDAWLPRPSVQIRTQQESHYILTAFHHCPMCIRFRLQIQKMVLHCSGTVCTIPQVLSTAKKAATFRWCYFASNQKRQPSSNEMSTV